MKARKIKIDASAHAKPGASLLLIIAFLFCFPGCSSRNVTFIKISIKDKSVFPVTDYKEIFVGNFFYNEVKDLDLNGEFRRFLKKECRQKTKFKIIEDEPAPLPSLSPEDLYKNPGFWKKMGESHQAPLIMTGSIYFELIPRTAFAMRQITTSDGRTVYRNVPEDYTDFKMSVNLVFIDGKTGEKLYEETLDNKSTVLRGRMEDFEGFATGLNRLSGRIMRILKPQSRTSTRAILSG